MISIGSEQACGVRFNNTVLCWGKHADRSTQPEGLLLSSVSTDSSNTCGLRLDRTAVCWGWGDHAGEGLPPWGARATFASIAVGDVHSCAIRDDDKIVCWGKNYDGQSSPPGGERYLDGSPTVPVLGSLTAISSGTYHTCGLRADGSPVCWEGWGVDWHGQATPPAGEKFATLSSGDNHTCALLNDGKPLCWGSDEYGQSSPPPQESLKSISSGGRSHLRNQGRQHRRMLGR